MAKYNPFAEKAGMKRIVEQLPPKEAVRIADLLKRLDFNAELLASKSYVLDKLKALGEKDVERAKEAFIESKLPRFKKPSSFICRLERRKLTKGRFKVLT
jgi:hypothetical protein